MACMAKQMACMDDEVLNSLMRELQYHTFASGLAETIMHAQPGVSTGYSTIWSPERKSEHIVRKSDHVCLSLSAQNAIVQGDTCLPNAGTHVFQISLHEEQRMDGDYLGGGCFLGVINADENVDSINTNMLTHGNSIRKDGEGKKTKPKKKKNYHGET